MPGGSFIKPLLSLVFQISRPASKNTTSSQSRQRSSLSTGAESIVSSDTYSVRFFNRLSSGESVSHRDAYQCLSTINQICSKATYQVVFACCHDSLQECLSKALLEIISLIVSQTSCMWRSYLASHEHKYMNG